MLKEYLVSIPQNITAADYGFKFYEEIQIIKCKAKNLIEIYCKYPDALKVELNENEKKRD